MNLLNWLAGISFTGIKKEKKTIADKLFSDESEPEEQYIFCH